MTTNKIPKTHPCHRQMTLAGVLATLLLTSIALAVPYLAAAKDKKDKNRKTAGDKQSLQALPASDLTPDQAVIHALNRLGYGPRPGDLDRVKQMGLAQWIDRQLHPESIDDSPLDARLARFPTLTMSSETLMNKFPQPQQAARRAGMSVEDYRKQQQQVQQQQQAMQLMQAVADSQKDEMPAQTGAGNPNPMLNYLQLQTPQRVVGELAMAKVDRAVYSERQLYEQMVDFWFNHFNVFAGKGLDRYLLTS